MAILNFGSLNYDHVYNVENFVVGKETITASGYNVYLGGKGLNQTIAIARSGGNVWHAGCVQNGDVDMVAFLQENSVNASLILQKNQPSGHAIIQIDSKSQNSIIVYGGANVALSEADVDFVLGHFEKGDFLVLQNEINCLGYAVEKAHQKGMIIALTPAPINENLADVDFSKISYLLLNEVEGAYFADMQDFRGDDFGEIAKKLAEKFPTTHIVMTIGSKGVIYAFGEEMVRVAGRVVKAVDTTAAGDTFAGYFISMISHGMNVENALQTANVAASISVTRSGASPSIPRIQEVQEVLGK